MKSPSQSLSLIFMVAGLGSASLLQAQDITNLIGYWPANEGTGGVVANAVDPASNGVMNNATWSADGEGHTGDPGDFAFRLTGEAGGGSNVEVAETGAVFEEATITAWINGVPTGGWTGIVYSRSAQAIGIDFSDTSGNLTYTWNDNSQQTWGFISNLNIPSNEWTFVAISLTPEAATLYVGTTGEGAALNSAVNAIPHLTQTHDQAPFLFGVDLCCGNERNFEGLMDDIAIWDVALTEEQIRTLWVGSATPLDVFDNSDPGVVIAATQDYGRLPFVAGTQELTLPVRNSGQTATLTLQTTLVEGGEHFALESAPDSLAPGEVGTIQLTFDPKGETGQFIGRLELVTNDPDEEDMTLQVELRVSLVDPAGPVGHYPLDETAGSTEALDITGNGRSGIYTTGDGQIEWEQDALAAGASVALSGGAHIAVPEGLLGMESFTALLWVEASPAEISVLFANGSELTPGLAVLLNHGDLAWFVDPDVVFSTQGAPVTSGETHHIAVVYDASTSSTPVASFYVDGSEVASQTVEAVALNQSAEVLSFGGIGSNSALGMNAVFDDIQLYNRALSPEEIQQLHQNPGAVLRSTGAVDSDGDGLSDEDEAARGTNPLDSDTDDDGLSDGDEVNTYGTLPTNVDSDGDGFDDASEALFGSDAVNPDIGMGTFLVRNVAAEPGMLFDGMDAFKAALADPTQIGQEVTVTSNVINFRDNAEGHFGNNAPFPIYGVEGDHDDFGIHAAGTFTINEAGVRAIGVNSDDGFQLFIDGELALEFPDPRASADTIGAAMMEAGEHTVELYFYERAGGAQVELFINTALGDVDTFGEGHFILLPATGESDVDTDGDGLPDYWENRYFGALDQGAEGDPDEDGLNNAGEFEQDTLPDNADSDGDTLSDGSEVNGDPATDPRSQDTDGDRLSDSREIELGTNPTLSDTDGDGATDGQEVDRAHDPLDPDDTPVILITAYEVSANTPGNQAFGGSLGMDFIVNREIEVLELGVFDDQSNGLNVDLEVILWRRDDGGTPADPTDDGPGEQLVTLSFSPEDAGFLENGSRFKALDAPLRLAPGAYTIVAYGYGAEEQNGNSQPGWTVNDGDGALQFVGGGRWIDVAGDWPSNVDGGPVNRYAAGTFKFRLAPTTGGDDDDHDGVPNEEEVLAGTDPQDPSDYFRISAVSVTADEVQLSWQSVAGRSYVVEFSTAMNGDWVVVSQAPIAATGDVLTFSMDPGNGGGFYRLGIATGNGQ